MGTNATFGTAKTSSRTSERKPTIPQSIEASDSPEDTMAPTYEQIAERALAIWRAKGCPNGQDEQNWHEAETLLRNERGDE